MGEAVQEDGVKARVTQKDLEPALGGRVALEDGLDLLLDGSKHTYGSMICDEIGRITMVSRGVGWLASLRVCDIKVSHWRISIFSPSVLAYVIR